MSDIIICGHSNCGAIQALIDKKEFRNMPHLRNWLKIALPVKDIVKVFYGDLKGEHRRRITEKENVLIQLRNIQTYPFVNRSLRKGSLYLHGWYYDIGKGDVYSYSPKTHVFEKVI